MPFPNGNTYYAGSNCYRYAEKLIKKGREVLIISPYIDEYYAKFLIENGKGKRIRIISSSIGNEAKRILSRKKPVGMLIAVFVAVLSLNCLLYLAFKLTTPMLVMSIMLLLASSLIFIGTKYDIIVKTPKNFVHSKMYIAENSVIHGSANLTYRGMHKNTEQIEIVNEQGMVERLRGEFLRLWKSV